MHSLPHHLFKVCRSVGLLFAFWYLEGPLRCLLIQIDKGDRRLIRLLLLLLLLLHEHTFDPFR